MIAWSPVACKNVSHLIVTCCYSKIRCGLIICSLSYCCRFKCHGGDLSKWNIFLLSLGPPFHALGAWSLGKNIFGYRGYLEWTEECFQTCSKLQEIPPESDEALLYESFGSLHLAMHTLFRSITGGLDWAVYAKALAEVNWLWTYLFTAFIAFSVFAVLNVMTGHENGAGRACGAPGGARSKFTFPYLLQDHCYTLLQMIVEHTALGKVLQWN